MCHAGSVHGFNLNPDLSSCSWWYNWRGMLAGADIIVTSQVWSSLRLGYERPWQTLCTHTWIEISQDTGKYYLAVDDILKALELGAVETLLVAENLDITRYALCNAAGDMKNHSFSKWLEDETTLSEEIVIHFKITRCLLISRPAWKWSSLLNLSLYLIFTWVVCQEVQGIRCWSWVRHHQ